MPGVPDEEAEPGFGSGSGTLDHCAPSSPGGPETHSLTAQERPVAEDCRSPVTFLPGSGPIRFMMQSRALKGGEQVVRGPRERKMFR